MAAQDVHARRGQLLHHDDARHELLLQDEVGQHLDYGYLMPALDELQRRLHADLAAAADDDVALHLGLAQQHVLRLLHVCAVYTRDVRHQRLRARAHEHRVRLDGRRVLRRHGAVQVYLHVRQPAQLHAEEVRDVLQDILAGRAGGYAQLTAAEPVRRLIDLDAVAALRGDIGRLQARRSSADDRHALFLLRLADLAVREAALAARDGVERAAQRHLAEDTLAYAVVAVDAAADALDVALLQLRNKVRLDYPLAGLGDEIRLTVRQYLLGNLGVEHAALREHRYAHGLLDGRGQVRQSGLRLINGGYHPLHRLKHRRLRVDGRDAVALHPLAEDL